MKKNTATTLLSQIREYPDNAAGGLKGFFDRPMASYEDRAPGRGLRKWYFSIDGTYANRKYYVLARDDEAELNLEIMLTVTIHGVDAGAMIEDFDFEKGFVLFDKPVTRAPDASFHSFSECTPGQLRFKEAPRSMWPKLDKMTINELRVKNGMPPVDWGWQDDPATREEGLGFRPPLRRGETRGAPESIPEPPADPLAEFRVDEIELEETNEKASIFDAEDMRLNDETN